MCWEDTHRPGIWLSSASTIGMRGVGSAVAHGSSVLTVEPILPSASTGEVRLQDANNVERSTLRVSRADTIALTPSRSLRRILDSGRQVRVVALTLVAVTIALLCASPALADSPHIGFTAQSDKCQVCHSPHVAAGNPILANTTETDTCYTCHDGTGANANVQDGTKDSFALASGHSIETTPVSGDLVSSCGSCHRVHGDSAASPMLPRPSINSTTVASAGNGWCLACHDSNNSWYRGSYPASDSVSRDASGYPIPRNVDRPQDVSIHIQRAPAHTRDDADRRDRQSGEAECGRLHVLPRRPSWRQQVRRTHGHLQAYLTLDSSFRPSRGIVCGGVSRLPWRREAEGLRRPHLPTSSSTSRRAVRRQGTGS